MEKNEQMEVFKEYVETQLLNEGFKTAKENWNLGYKDFTLGDEAYTKLEKNGFKSFNGNTLHVNEVRRHNGTSENISIKFEMMEWNQNSGHCIFKEKISYKDSKKKQDRIIKEVVEKYKEFLKLGNLRCENE